MHSPVHTVAGLLLAQVKPDPVTALAADVASHYLLDAMPHGDTGLRAISGITPDLLWGLRFVLDQRGWHIPGLTSFLPRHDRWPTWGHAKHFYDVPFAVGLVVQAVLLSLVYFYTFSNRRGWVQVKTRWAPSI